MFSLHMLYLLGQGWVLQASVSVLPPWQAAPPKLGEGLLHSLSICLVPPLQVTEHPEPGIHWLHPPSPELKKTFVFVQPFAWNNIIHCLNRPGTGAPDASPLSKFGLTVDPVMIKQFLVGRFASSNRCTNKLIIEG